jgi:flagellar biosynthetic protein FliR
VGPISVTLPVAGLETTMLASVRVAAFLVLAPPFSHRSVPGAVKAALAVGVGLAVSPRLAPLPSDTTGAFLGALVLQAVIGAALGFVVALALSAVQSAGALVDLFGGFQVAQAYDPLSMTSGAQFQRLYEMTALALLFAGNGYQIVLTGLVRTFDALPLGVALSTDALGDTLTRGLGQAFVGAVQIAGPLLVVLVLADVGLGLLTRVAPALNAFALGFPLKVLLTLALASFAYLALPAVVDALAGHSVGSFLGTTR